MSKLNLIMPMGGGGTRFGNHGFNLPKPLIEIYKKPFFYWAAQSILKFTDVESLTFVVLREHVEKFSIDKRIYEYYPQAKINIIEKVLPGAVLTCMEGVKSIDNDKPIMFNDCDHLFICREFADFCKLERFNELDGALLTFKSEDPKFSFVAFDEEGFVNRTVEKQAISNDAICGAYYFKNRQIFEKEVGKYLDNCSYSEYFVSGVYNEMAKDKLKIKNFNTDEHVSFGTPEEFEEAKLSTVYKELE